MDVSTPIPIQFNLTGIFLRDLTELDFDLLKRNGTLEKPDALTPSALSTVGLRRATESHSVMIHNYTGMDVDIRLDDSTRPSAPECSVHFDSVGPGIIRNSCCASIDSVFENLNLQKNLDNLAKTTATLSLRLSESATAQVGSREVVSDLPIASSAGKSVSCTFSNQQ